MHLRRHLGPIRSLLAAGIALGLFAGNGSAQALAPAAGAISADPSDVAPIAIDGEVLDHAQIGNRIYVAGTFTQIKNANARVAIDQRSLFAYDAATGRIDSGFAPKFDHIVTSLATDGTSLFVGGRFTSINGIAKNRLAKLAPVTGAPLSWHGNANGTVEDLAWAGGTLVVGGTFTKLKNVARGRLGAFNTTTGQLDSDLDLTIDRPGWTGTTDVRVLRVSVSPDGSRILIGGAFNLVGGQTRRQVAMIDRTTSPDSVTPWSNDGWGEAPRPGFTCIHELPFAPDGTWFVVTAMCGSTPLGDAIARFETADVRSSVQPTWVNWTGWDTLWGATISSDAIYVGGHQKSMNACRGCSHLAGGAVPRPGLAALDPLNGVPLSWNPGRDRGVGAKAMTLSSTGLLVGHDTNLVAGEWHPRHASFPTTGGTLPVQEESVLPATMTVVNSDGTTSGAFDGTSGFDPAATVVDPASALDADLVRGAFRANGRTYYLSNADQRMKSRTFDGVSWGDEIDVASIPGYWNPNWMSYSTTNTITYNEGWLYQATTTGQLVRRGFALESQIVGTQAIVASGPGADTFNWSSTRGLAIAGGYLFFSTASGELHRMAMAGHNPDVTTDTVIAGPNLDGTNYAGSALLIES